MTYEPNEAEEIAKPPRGDASPGDDWPITEHLGTIPPAVWGTIMGDDVPDDWFETAAAAVEALRSRADPPAAPAALREACGHLGERHPQSRSRRPEVPASAT